MCAMLPAVESTTPVCLINSSIKPKKACKDTKISSYVQVRANFYEKNILFLSKNRVKCG